MVGAPLAPEDVPEALWPQPSHATAVTARDAGFYRYLVDVSLRRHALFGLRERGELVGYFCLAFAPHVARIADLWLPSTKRRGLVRRLSDGGGCWRARERMSTKYRRGRRPRSAKKRSAGAGFRLRERSALSVFGDARILAGRELHVQMLDSDAGFLSADRGVSDST